MINKNYKFELDKLLNYLMEIYKNTSNASSRRENAVWAATLLYFTIIFILFRFIFENNDKIPEISIFMILIMLFSLFLFFLFFILFIHTQYGLHTNDVSVNRMLLKIIFEIINKQELPKDFNWKISQKHIFPETLEKELRNISKEIHKIDIRMIVFPYIFFINFVMKCLSRNKSRKDKFERKNKEIPKIRLHESIIYNLLFIPTIYFFIFCLMIFFKII